MTHSAATSTATASAVRSPWECVGWSVALIALVSSWLLPGDGFSAFETGVVQASLWCLLALAAYLPLGLGAKPTRRASRKSVRAGMRPIDWAVAAWVVWYVVAAVIGIATHEVWARQAATLGMQALGWAALYALGRWVARDRDRTALALTWALGGAIFLSSFAAYQAAVTMPAARAEYFDKSEEAKQATMRQLGISRTDPQSRERRLLEDRLRSTEPTSTFTLANSLGVVLCGAWYVLLEWTGVLLWRPWLARFGRAGEKESDSENLVERGPPGPPMTGRLATVLLLAGMLLVAVVLVLTKSRAALLAAALLSLYWALRFAWEHRITLLPWAMGGMLVLGLVGGFATGKLDWQVISEAPKSLLYRAQYWQATLPMIGDHPWIGVGPGSYQDRYRQYQAVEASETVADPHNAWVEATAVSGIPAGLALLVVTLLALRLALPRRSVTGADACDHGATLPQSQRDGWTFFPNPWAAMICVVGGLLAATVLGTANMIYLGFDPDFVGWLLAAVPAVLVALGAWASHADGWLDRDNEGVLFRRAAGGAVASMALALLVTGGYGFWGVAQWMWGLLGITVTLANGSTTAHSTPSTAPSTEPKERPWPFFAWGVSMVTVVIGLGWVVRPTVETWTQLRRVERRMPRDMASVESGLLQWARQHPLSEEPWERLAEIAHAKWQQSDGRDEDREAFGDMVARANQLRPESAAICERWGFAYLAAWDRRHDARDIEAALKWFERMVELAPNDAYLRAQLARTYALSGRNDRAAAEAERALELDRFNPHADRALKVQLLMTPNGPDLETAEQRMLEIRSKVQAGTPSPPG